MDVAALLALFRAEAKDQKQPYLWSDAVLISYAAQAEAEIARRTRCLYDFTTPALTVIPVTALNHTYKLDARVLFVRRLKLASQPWVLEKCDMRDLDVACPGWEEMMPSAPVAWFPPGYRHIRLVPAPDADDAIHLHVIRLPLDPLTGLGDEPEIEERFHDGMVHWMLYRAYGKQDSQTSDPKKAATALAEFENQFGPVSTARDELWIEHKHGMDDYEGVY